MDSVETARAPLTCRLALASPRFTRMQAPESRCTDQTMAGQPKFPKTPNINITNQHPHHKPLARNLAV